MLYIGLILFGCLFVWNLREASRTTHEREMMNDYHRSEYQRAFLTTN